MSKIKLSTDDELAIAEYIANLGGIKSPSDDDLWEILEYIDIESIKSMVFEESN